MHFICHFHGHYCQQCDVFAFQRPCQMHRPIRTKSSMMMMMMIMMVVVVVVVVMVVMMVRKKE